MAESSDSNSQSGMSWIEWFCGLKGNEFFVEVPEEFIQDEFNLYGLSNTVQNYDYALDMILDNESDDELEEEQQEVIERNAETLYGLIHARFIVTALGLQMMLEKLRQGDFGMCPRINCFGQQLLPVGLSDVPMQHTLKMFCPSCQEIYFPKYTRHSTIDGAYFGTTFPHLLVLQYPEIIQQRACPPYVPKIFGFRIHPRAASNQRRAAKQQQIADAMAASAAGDSRTASTAGAAAAAPQSAAVREGSSGTASASSGRSAMGVVLGPAPEQKKP